MIVSNVNSQAAHYSAALQQPRGPDKGPSYDDLLSRLDANGDQGLGIDEVSISEEAFAKADANNDGVIDQTEFESGANDVIHDDLQAQGTLPPMGPPPEPGPEPSFDEVLSMWDADGDGTLSIDELGASEEAFAKADANNDGIIDQTEFKSGANKIIGDDLRAQGPPENVPQTDSDSSGGSASATGSLAYQHIQNLLQNGSSEVDQYYSGLLMTRFDMLA